MAELPIVGCVIAAVAALLLLAGSGFTGSDGSGPAPPRLTEQAALRGCADSFNRRRPMGSGASGAAHLQGNPQTSCRLRVGGGPSYVMAGGIWMQETAPPPGGPANADLVAGRLTLR